MLADKKSDERDVASSVRTKGREVLFDQVELDKNAVISPLSVIGCMYMLAAGAAGESRREILDAMGFERLVSKYNTWNFLRGYFLKFLE